MSSTDILLLISHYSSLKQIQKKIYKLTLVAGFIAVIVLVYVFLPINMLSAHKDSAFTFLGIYPSNEEIQENSGDLAEKFTNSVPKPAHLPAKKVYYVSTTAYNSDPWQTDDTPCITANGFDVCEHGTENIIATNMLPFGTKVRFPELHGEKVFIVMDRMNARYTTRVDFWMLDRQDARNFGLKHRVKMEVL